MANPAFLYLTLHIALGALLAGLAAYLMWQPERALLRLQILLAALLSALAPRLLYEIGQWADLSDRAETTIILLSLAMALLSRRFVGDLAAFALGSLWVALGLASLRHGLPFAPTLAAKAIAAGGLILILPHERTGRWRQGFLLFLLAVSAGFGPISRMLPP